MPKYEIELSQTIVSYEVATMTIDAASEEKARQYAEEYSDSAIWHETSEEIKDTEVRSVRKIKE